MGRHQARLNSLSGRLQALGADHWCEECGGVAPRGLARECIALEEGQDLQSCPACGMALDENGRVLGWIEDGEQMHQVVVLHSGPAPHPDGLG